MRIGLGEAENDGSAAVERRIGSGAQSGGTTDRQRCAERPTDRQRCADGGLIGLRGLIRQD